MLKILRPARRGVVHFLGRSSPDPVAADSSLVVPDFALSATGHNVAELVAPSVTLVASGTAQSTNDANLAVPEFSLSARSGGVLGTTLEDLVLSATGSNTDIGRADLMVSPFTLAATGVLGALGTASLQWQAQPGIVAASGAAAAVIVPKTTLSAGATTGSVGTAGLVVPDFVLTTATTSEITGSAAITMPEFRLLWGEARLVVPQFVVLAAGGEVIAASAAVAYSVNLSHGGLTRYPGFSFDHILKQDGKYYGVRADGVYLLEGTTDDGSAIDVLLKTGDMDLGNAFEKRVPYVYTGSAEIINIKTILDGTSVGPVQAGFNNRRARLGRGASGQYVALEISNEAGNELKIDDVELLVETKSRRAF